MSPGPNLSGSRVFGLDVVRATAIWGVLIAHGIPFLYTHLSQIGYLGHLGSVGVDLFFVLSGFLIGGILLRTGETIGTARGLGGFWLRRWIRTLPNYYVFVLVNLAFAVWVRRGPDGFEASVVTVATFTENVFTAPRLLFFPESWTLAVEEWFYLVAPLFLALLVRAGMRFREAYLLVGLLMLVLPSLARISAPDTLSWHGALRLVVVFRVDSIACGFLAAYVAATRPNAWKRLAVPGLAVGFLLSVAAYVSLFVLELETSRYARTLLFTQFNVGFALLLPAASAWRATRETLLVRAVRACALWSYSIYLCNWLYHLLIALFLMERVQASAAFATAAVLGFFVASLATGALAYHLWEKRFTALRNRIPWARSGATAASRLVEDKSDATRA
ncbi:acyltransferase [Opitutales bacterium ASA1]|uniref:acyltransferase family protein n=1 Tax=Congregicoccus parvus TaxID=3081749 RepID=UPI002B2B803E|nr:acyltransferase [Opitutales bacterium ASA1]